MLFKLVSQYHRLVKYVMTIIILVTAVLTCFAFRKQCQQASLLRPTTRKKSQQRIDSLLGMFKLMTPKKIGHIGVRNISVIYNDEDSLVPARSRARIANLFCFLDLLVHSSSKQRVLSIQIHLELHESHIRRTLIF